MSFASKYSEDSSFENSMQLNLAMDEGDVGSENHGSASSGAATSASASASALSVAGAAGVGAGDDKHQRRNRKRLSVNVNTSYTESPSYDVTQSVFTKGNIAIGKTSVQMRGRNKRFVVNKSELQIGETIGRGSSSFVQRAVHIPTGTQLALKNINMFDKGKRDQLMREIETLYDASCEAIVGFFGAFYSEGVISVALEYMDGGSLTNMLHQIGPLNEGVLAPIAYQVIYGLAYLKSVLKRMHRDLKPSNILVNSSGLVKLTDFGIARELESSMAFCETFVGTFKYMSPERIRNERYDYASDVWSLGIILIEACTGEYPYSGGDSYISHVQSVLEQPSPTLPSIFSKPFQELVATCLQKDPKQRLPADILIGSPFFKMHGVISLSMAQQFLCSWIQCGP